MFSIKATVLMSIVVSIAPMAAYADRGPYFENATKAPITHGKLVFNSPELSSLGSGQYIGDVVIQKNSGGFEVGPMIYKCEMNEDDGAYGSLGCKYLRYNQKKAVSYSECEIFENEFYNCY